MTWDELIAQNKINWLGINHWTFWLDPAYEITLDADEEAYYDQVEQDIADVEEKRTS